jgi:hypothetical protein
LIKLAVIAISGDACEDGFGVDVAGGFSKGIDPATACIPQPKVLYNSLPTDVFSFGALQICGNCLFDLLQYRSVRLPLAQ